LSEQTPGLAVLTRLELYFSLRLITRTLRRFADLVDYDYDTVMIFFVVLESCFQSIIPFGGAEADLETIERAYRESVSLGLSLLTIGEACGIPRETVRRKVKMLTERGLLASSERSRNIYVPITMLLRPDVIEVFRIYAVDADQFARTVRFYTAPER